MSERERCGYRSRIDGEQCLFYASGHTMHLTASDPSERDLPLRESYEDSPDWDPEGIKAWERQRAARQ